MPLYRLRRHVLYDSACGQTREVWGADRPFGSPALKTRPAPRDTDADDPLRRGGRDCGCAVLLVLDDEYVTWDDIWAWTSVAEAAGYEIVSGFKKLSPYSLIVLRGP